MSTLSPTHNNWKQNFFVYGHLAKGVVYLLIGGLSAAAAIGAASGPTGPKEVVMWLQDQPFGQILLVILALGLLCYCAWRWIKAIYDIDHDGDDKEGMAKRIGYAASGSFYGILAILAISLATGSGSGGAGGGSGSQDMLAQILSESWGQIVVGIIGLIVIGVGIFQLKRGLNEEYMQKISTSQMDPKERDAYRTFGKVGHIARAVVYGIIAYFLIRVALSSDASEFRGMGGALEYLGGQTFGGILLGLVGLGLLLYGAFMLVKAKYGHI